MLHSFSIKNIFYEIGETIGGLIGNNRECTLSVFLTIYIYKKQQQTNRARMIKIDTSIIFLQQKTDKFVVFI